MPDGVYKKKHSDMLSYEEIKEIVSVFVKKGITKIRLTGGEPLIRKNIEELVKYIREYDEIKDIAITTNAHNLYEKAEILSKNGLNRVNISLDSLDADKYRKISKNGNLNDVFKSIEKSQEIGLGVKINCVLMRGINDTEVPDFMDFAQKYDLDLRFIELMPIGKVAKFSKDKFISSDEIIKKYNLLKIENSDKNSPTSLYKLKSSDFRVGFISALSHSFCSSCNRLRLTSDGFIRPCLHSDLAIDLKKGLGNEKKLDEFIDKALLIKPMKHHMENMIIKESMYRIGG